MTMLQAYVTAMLGVSVLALGLIRFRAYRKRLAELESRRQYRLWIVPY